ncbi:MAG: AI-2E family transporter [bacterium]
MASTDNKRVLIDISTLTLIKVLLIIVAAFFLFYIRDIVLIVFVALILSSAFDPIVNWLQKKGVPRSLGIGLIYLSMIVIVGSSTYLIIPPLIIEINQLSKDFPMYWEKLNGGWQFVQAYSNGANIQDYISTIESNLSGALSGVFSTVSSFFGGVISFIVIMMITFYMTIEEQSLKRVIRSMVPDKYQPYTMQLINRMQEKIGLWLRGQIILSVIIFLLAWLGLSVLGVKYALVLALFVGVTEIIPYLGAIAGAVPAVLIAFTQSTTLGLWTIFLYLLIHQSENHILVPQVMKKTVGLNPIVVIVVILIGAQVAGLWGVLLSVPVTTALSVLIEDLWEIKKEEA